MKEEIVDKLYKSSLVNSEAAIPYMSLHANQVKELCEHIKKLEQTLKSMNENSRRW